jgi:hypothetical protein
MIQIGILDNIIAVVVVILLLSLIVQSFQTFIKKLLKLKSRQIEDSLIDIFENVLAKQSKPAGPVNASPVMRMLTRRSVTEGVDPDVAKLYDKVSERFRDVGRFAQLGDKALESLSKDDLKKVTASVGLDQLLPAAAKAFDDMCKAVDALDAVLTKIETAKLTGEAGVKWAVIRQTVVPLINDVASITRGTGAENRGTALVSHILALRNVSVKDLLELISALRKQIDEDKTRATAASEAALAATLKESLTQIDEFVGQLGKISAKLDEATAPVRSLLAGIETWYDTVMQSFEERYARSMRTWAFGIGLALTICLNAGLFDVYRRVSMDPKLRDQIIAKAPKLEDEYQKQLKEMKGPAKPADTKEALRDAVTSLQEDLDELGAYDSFGLVPFEYPGLTLATFLPHLVGWLIMALLLSLGAPFWHDTLESLFGIKNLLRDKGKVKNTEQRSGEGATQ